MVEGGMKCIKYLLFAFNLIFVIAAITLITVGIIVQTKFNVYLSFFGGNVNAAAILIIVVGFIIFLIAFFGCCGAIKENYTCTMVFAVLLAIIFICELAGGIAGFVMKSEIKTEAKKKMLTAEMNYNKSSGVRKSWDTVQKSFNCCGVEKFGEWFKVLGSVPDSCCINETTGCGSFIKSGDPYTNVKKSGCLDGFIAWAKRHILLIGGFGIGLAFIQVVGIIFACCLARAIKKEYEVV